MKLFVICYLLFGAWNFLIFKDATIYRYAGRRF